MAWRRAIPWAAVATLGAALLVGAVAGLSFWMARRSSTGEESAVNALLSGIEAVPPIRSRLDALIAVSAMGAAGVNVVEALAEFLDDECAAVRSAAAQKLGELGAGASAAVPALLKSAKSDKSLGVRMVAIQALARAASDTPEVRTVLGRIAEGREQWLGLYARSALIHVTGEREVHLPYLVEALDPGRDSHIRAAAADALGHLGALAESAVPALVVALRSEDPWVRLNVAYALGNIAQMATVSIPALKSAAAVEDDSEAGFLAGVAAVYSLGRFRASAPEAVDALLGIAEHGQPALRNEALKVLSQLEP